MTNLPTKLFHMTWMAAYHEKGFFRLRDCDSVLQSVYSVSDTHCKSRGVLTHVIHYKLKCTQTHILRLNTHKHSSYSSIHTNTRPTTQYTQTLVLQLNTHKHTSYSSIHTNPHPTTLYTQTLVLQLNTHKHTSYSSRADLSSSVHILLPDLRVHNPLDLGR